MAQLKITWTKSYIGKPRDQRRVIHALGLKRLHHTVIHGDNSTVRGMVRKVGHLLAVEEVEEEPSWAGDEDENEATTEAEPQEQA